MFFRKGLSGSSGKMPLPRTAEIRTRRVVRVGRNDPCPCGSGKKYKHCHETEGDLFLSRLARQQEIERREEEDRQAGVPWIKRVINRLVR
jgi:hypothetical protein